MLKKQNDPVVSEIRLNRIIGNTDKSRLFFANKVVSSRKGQKGLFTIGEQKDLVYKLKNGVYITLSDFNDLNEKFVSKGSLHKLFDLEQYERYVETCGVMTFAGEVDLTREQQDFIYLSRIQGLNEYGIKTFRTPNIGMNYDDIIKELKRINRFLKKYAKRNLNDPSINQSLIHRDYVYANENNFDTMIDALNKDSVNNELSLIYSLKKHRV